MCDLASNGNDDPRRCSFEVGEFAVLEGGHRVVLHRERGFTASTNADDIWAHQTVDSITHDVLCVVLPDDAEITGDDHPWEWFAELLRVQGIDAVGDQLRGLPYEVVLAEGILQRLPGNLHPSPEVE